MLNNLEKLCNICAPPGAEHPVAELIMNEIKPYCECKIDRMGNVLAFKKGAFKPEYKVLLDAHTDEVGFIINEIDESGFLHFSILGGVNVESILCKRVKIGDVIGVVQIKPVHLLKGDESKHYPSKDALTIDIGATSREDALKHVGIGDCGSFYSDYVDFGDGYVKAKALDDRVGCAILIELIKSDLQYDTWFSFTVQEELGLRGAKVAANSVQPDCAIIIESTTAADLPDVSADKTVCLLGEGAVVSFMDGATIYEDKMYRETIKAAETAGIKIQAKRAVSGGNNAGAVHLSNGGVRTLSLSVPCRYLHSSACVIKSDDISAVAQLANVMLEKMASGSV